MKKVLVLVLFLLASVDFAIAEAPSVQSSNVNDVNFQHLNYGNVVVKANGVEIGTLIGVDSQRITVLTSKGYIIEIYVRDNSIYPSHFAYTTNDCTGTPYVRKYDSYNGWILNRGTGELFYIDRSATLNNLSINGSIFNGNTLTCSAGTINSGYWPATPNDPAVTGVSSTTFAPPITIERR